MTKMDKAKLAQIVNEDPVAKAAFKHFLTRDRNPKDGIMDIRRAKYALQEEGVDVVPEELVSIFRDMEKAGCGKLISESGKPVRFRWTVNMKEAAKAALSTTGVVSKKTKASGKTDSDGNSRDMVLMLAPGRKARISLPVGLTPDEAEFIAEAIKDSVQ